MTHAHFPPKQGLYDPRFEHDSCGVGFVCNIKGKKSNEIIIQGIEVLNRLAHRGAVGSDPKTGDGAGILLQVPDEFCIKVASQAGITLPGYRHYGTGVVFFPADKKERQFCIDTFEKIIAQEKQVLLGWRDVVVDNSVIGKTARAVEPFIRQVFISRSDLLKDQLDFERKLYIIRKQTENIVRTSARIWIEAEILFLCQ